MVKTAKTMIANDWVYMQYPMQKTLKFSTNLDRVLHIYPIVRSSYYYENSKTKDRKMAQLRRR